MLPVYILIVWALGFAHFYTNLKQEKNPAHLSGDAIVVLTGGAGRIEMGLGLLRNGQAPKLLISGVNPSVEIPELTALTGAEAELFSCCIDLDRTASNTLGNARETAAWARGHGFQTILLVTADYHMPRSHLLFKSALPEATIIPIAVKTDVSAAYLIKEYNKYLFTVMRHATV